MDPVQVQEQQTVRLAEQYFSKYKKHMQAFEKSLVSKATTISEHHLVQLGKQLDAFGLYQSMCEANGSLNTLGELPKVALDVITATMSNSILPVIASTQTIEAQKQLIYFKNIRAEDTKGNLTAMQKIVDPRLPLVTPAGYASNFVSALTVATGDGTATHFAFSLGVPVRSQFIKFYLTATPAIFCQDMGPMNGQPSNQGTLLGAGVSGTINYDSGAVDLYFAVAPANLATVKADYQVNLESATDLPRITSFLDNTTIEAKSYALKSVMGMFQQFALKKQFGDSALDDMTMDLTREVNAEIGGDFIRQYAALGSTPVTFSLTVPAGVSEKLYRESYAFRMADAEAALIAAAGRGTIKVMIVGLQHAALVRGLDGFQLLSDGNSLGAHIFGTYKGVTYVRVPEQALLDTKAGIGLYTGASPLESAGVYAPFMPLVITQTQNLSPNPLNEQKAAATMAGTKVVVPQYAQNFDLVA